MNTNNNLENNLLTREEEVELFKRVEQKDESAIVTLMDKNIGLVKSFCAKYADFNDMEELVSAGRLGLLKAIKSFDYTLGYRFSTHAFNWIRHEVLRFMDENHLVSASNGIIELSRAYKKSYEAAAKYYNAPSPTDEMIGKFLPEKFPMDRIDDVKFYINTSVASLDKNIGDDEDTPFGDMIASDSYQELENDITRKEQTDLMNKLKYLLSPAELAVFEFKQYDEDNTGFREIGNRFGFSGERARQLYNSAIDKMRKEVALHYSDLMV